MDVTAQIGPSISVKGEVTSGEPLTIYGHVEGSVSVDGHPLTIAAGGRADAELIAQIIVVAGSVSGTLNAVERVVVNESATIDGDLAAPVVSFAEGATLHGRIETAQRKAKLQLAS